MDSNGPSGRVTSSAGDVDLHGDVLNIVRHARLRVQVGEHRTADVDPDVHARYVARLVAAGRAGLTPAAVIA